MDLRNYNVDVGAILRPRQDARDFLHPTFDNRTSETAVHVDQLPGSFFGPSNVVELLRHRATHQGDDVGLRYLTDGERNGVQWTYAEIDRRSRAIAASLQAMDMEGERALLLYPSGLDFIAAFFGCLYAGVTAVPAYPPRRNRNMARIDAIANDAQAKIALTTTEVLERVQTMVADTPSLQQIRWRSTDQWYDDELAEQWSRPNVRGDTLAFLQYTSGSTGTPKGVMLTHSNLMHNSAMITYAFEHSRSGSGCFWLPLYHDMGLIGGILQPFYMGRPNTILSPTHFLQKPVRWLQAMSQSGATISGGPNFAYDLCVEKVTPEQKRALDLSRWSLAFNGAEPVRAETMERFAAAFAECGFRYEAFYPCYGLAEATLIVAGGYKQSAPVVQSFAIAPLEKHQAVPTARSAPGSRALVGSGGNLLDQTIVIVHPETCQPCRADEVGEIWVAGPSVAQGYWGRSEQSHATFAARLEDGRGPFLRTGDLGFLRDGELFVTGRLKDLIILRGVNYYPQDIEASVEAAHPDVKQGAGAAFSVGRDDQERMVIVQETVRRRDLDFAEIVDSIRKRVAQDHDVAVEAIVLLKTGSIPKTSSGKIQRHACQAGHMAGTLAALATWSTETGQVEIAPSVRRSRDDEGAFDSDGMEAAADGDPWIAVHPHGSPPASGSGVRSGAPPHVPGVDQTAAGAEQAGRHRFDPAARLQNGAAPAQGAALDSTPARRPDADRQGDPAQRRPEIVPPGNAQSGYEPTGHVPTETQRRIVEVVYEKVRDVGRERVGELTWDTNIVELGLDSLERMEIVASLEEAFGGRFPEHALPQMETCGEVVLCVEAHLGDALRQPPQRTTGAVMHSQQPSGQQPHSQQIDPRDYNFALSPEYAQLQKNLQIAASTGLPNPYFTVHEGVTRDRTIIDGQQLINFCSYNYLGMSGDPYVTRAAQRALEMYGTSVSASRLVSGQKPVHVELERAIADFIGTEAAIVFVGGHSTNESVIGHLFGPGDLILHDALSHNSILQGAILSGARRRPFPHNDWRACDQILSEIRHEYRRVLIVVEGVYSMDGDYPDLPQFVALRHAYKTYLMIDEAHSMGTMGLHGRGMSEHFGVNPRDVDVWMGTLSKSLGSCGGYIAACRELVEYLKYTAPGFVYSVGLSPANAVAALASLELLQDEPERVARLAENARLFLRLAKDVGLNTGMSNNTPVVPVITGNSEHALRLSHRLRERGINVQPILYPAVEERAARLRFFITSCHTTEQIQFAVQAVAEELDRIDPSYRGPACGTPALRALKQAETALPPR